MREHYAQGVSSIYRWACPTHNVTLLLTFKKVINMIVIAFFSSFLYFFWSIYGILANRTWHCFKIVSEDKIMSTAPFLSNTSFFRKNIFCFYCLEKKGWSDEFIKQKNYHEHFELVHQDVPQIRKLRDNQIRSDTTRSKTENNSDTKLKKGTSRNVFFLYVV